MEKSQYELCIEVLRRFHRANILDDFILIGSWCVPFYEDYFEKVHYVDHVALKTRDLDILIESPRKIKHHVDIPELLKDLGFVTTFSGSQGYIKLDHPELVVEFLVPERGKGQNKPCPLPQLAINATPLRFLNFLSENTIKVKIENFYVTLPHPANFALHKLIIFQRRSKADKAAKDIRVAIDILNALIKKAESGIVRSIFESTIPKWQKKIIKGLERVDEKEILEILL